MVYYGEKGTAAQADAAMKSYDEKHTQLKELGEKIMASQGNEENTTNTYLYVTIGVMVVIMIQLLLLMCCICKRFVTRTLKDAVSPA